MKTEADILAADKLKKEIRELIKEYVRLEEVKLKTM